MCQCTYNLVFNIIDRLFIGTLINIVSWTSPSPEFACYVFLPRLHKSKKNTFISNDGKVAMLQGKHYIYLFKISSFSSVYQSSKPFNLFISILKRINVRLYCPLKAKLYLQAMIFGTIGREAYCPDRNSHFGK